MVPRRSSTLSRSATSFSALVRSVSESVVEEGVLRAEGLGVEVVPQRSWTGECNSDVGALGGEVTTVGDRRGI